MKTRTHNTDRTPLYKGVTRVACDWLAAAEYGYEMDCLISEEFTPPMEYGWLNERVEQLLASYGAMEAYFEWLTGMAERNKQPYHALSVYEHVLGTLQYTLEEADESLLHEILN
jgi:hypothetical protein